MERCIIVAVSDNNAIGVGGDMPWHISEDLKFFKRTTLGCPVIMGRTTFESLGSKPLPGRKNIVLSRQELRLPEGVSLAGSMEEAYTEAENAATMAGVERYFVIGGASVYAKVINDMDCLYITEIHTLVENADAYFPTIDLSVWKEISRSESLIDEKSGYSFEFVCYRKR